VNDFGYVAGGWRVDQHPRFVVDVTGDGRADIVGFGNAGVYVSRNNGDGTFQAPQRVVNDFGYVAGGWRVDQHPRFVVDVTGDGRADIVGFGNAGVYVSRNEGDPSPEQAGPRVVGTSVNYNPKTGFPISILVTFDKGVDPATFGATLVSAGGVVRHPSVGPGP